MRENGDVSTIKTICAAAHDCPNCRSDPNPVSVPTRAVLLLMVPPNPRWPLLVSGASENRARK